MRDAAPALFALLAVGPDELAGADPEFADYYTRELLPRIIRPWSMLSPEDVLEVDFDGDGEREMALIGAWRDTFFIHDLWFVAILEQAPRGHHRIVVFERLSAPVSSFGLVDLDGDARPEVVVLTQLGIARNDAPTHATVISGGRAGWRVASLPGGDCLELVDVKGEKAFLSWSAPTGERSGEAYRWTRSGFLRAADLGDLPPGRTTERE